MSNQYQEQQVIHRTANCVIYGGQQPQSKQQKHRDLSNKGWMAPQDKPYVALGDFQNVISVVEGLKNQIPHAKEMSAETQKNISKVRRQQNPLFRNGRPDRTLRILAKQPDNQKVGKGNAKAINLSANFIDLKGIGEVDSTSIMKKMKMIEEQFLTTASHFHDNQLKHQNQKHNQIQSRLNEDITSSYDVQSSTNQRLITPALKKLMNSKDASVMLKEEIVESQLRLKAAKYGHKLDEIVPQYNHSFYLPDKQLYFEKSSYSFKISNSLNRQNPSKTVYNPNKSFNQSQQNYNTQPSNQNYSAFMTEPSLLPQNSSHQAKNDLVKSNGATQHSKIQQQNNVSDYLKKRAGLTRNDQNYQSMKNDRSDLSHSHNNLDRGQMLNNSINNRSYFSQKQAMNLSYQSQNRISNNQDQNNESQNNTFYKKAFKTFDNGNKLSPRKPQKLNELSIKYKMMNNGNTNEYGDDLLTRNHQQKLANTNDPLQHRGALNQDNHIKFVSMIDSKPVQPPYLNLIPLKNFNKKDQELARLQMKEQTTNNNQNSQEEGSKQNNNLNWGKMLNEDLDDLLKSKVEKLYEEMIKKRVEQARRKTLLDMMKQGESGHQVAANSEELKKKLYTFFFNWSKDLGQPSGSPQMGDESHIQKQMDFDTDSRGGKGSINDEQEEKRKRLQLKLDQELIEFEERGGFAKVLKDIFNPQDINSMELDSVFQLKMLCKTFYEKKDKLSTNLIQTLDALTNERPKTLNMKKNNLNMDMKNSNVHDDIEWMRINAERQRIQQYRKIAKESAVFYYKVLKKFTEENHQYEKEKALEKSINIDPQVKMKTLNRENILKDILNYITDFMRAVIENGNKFTKDHFYMMLKELNSEHIDTQLAKYLRIMIEELEITLIEFDDFIIESDQNPTLQQAYDSIKDYLF
eukprot:403370464